MTHTQQPRPGPQPPATQAWTYHGLANAYYNHYVTQGYSPEQAKAYAAWYANKTMQQTTNQHGVMVQHPYTVKTGLSVSVHLLHATLTVFTCGVWGLVWGLHYMAATKKTQVR